jgi:hypothetical protein
MQEKIYHVWTEDELKALSDEEFNKLTDGLIKDQHEFFRMLEEENKKNESKWDKYKDILEILEYLFAGILCMVGFVVFMAFCQYLGEIGPGYVILSTEELNNIQELIKK